MAYDNSNRGAIWKNDDKREDNHPDFKGSLNVGGVDYWVSAWKRKPDASDKAPALSFSVKPKDEQKTISQRATETIKRPDPISSGLPPKRSVLPDDDMQDEVPF